jgi:tetratricopeptide (TPR) repeat protein
MEVLVSPPDLQDRDHGNEIRSRFSAKARRAGQLALEYLYQYANDPNQIEARRPMLLQALASVITYGNAPALAIQITMLLNEPMVRASLWSDWENYLERALAVARQSQDLLGQFRILRYLGDTRVSRGEARTALAPLEAAIALESVCVEHGNHEWVRAFCRYAECLLELERIVEAETILQRALALAQQRADRLAQAIVWGQLGRIYTPRGDWERARQHFSEALDAALAIGAQDQILSNTNFLGMVCLELGRSEDALSYYAEALALCCLRGEKSGQGVVLCNVGHAHLRTGNLSAARFALEAALTVHRTTGQPLKLARVLISLGQWTVQQGETQVAAGYLVEAIRLAAGAGNACLLGRAAWVMGDYSGALGETSAARLAYQRSHDWLVSAGETWQAAQVAKIFLSVQKRALSVSEH